MTNEIIARDEDTADLAPHTYEELMDFARMVANSGLAPKDYDGKPEKCAVAMQWGNELGLKPMQSLQNIAVVGNRPSLWGDAVLALVTSSPACKDVIEFFEDEDTEDMTAVCIAQRHGKGDKTGRFSIADAQTAGLVGKDVWQKYPKRMLQMRARGFALRDQFPDVLRGIPITELVREAIDMGRVEEVDPATGEVRTETAGAKRAGTADRVKSKLRRVTLAAVIKAIDDARDADALKAAGDMAARLADDDEKRQAREHWQAKLNAERAKSRADTKGDAKTDPKTEPQADQKDNGFTVTYAEVASSMESAERRGDIDALAAAADLIAQVGSKKQQAELRTLFDAAMERMQGTTGETT
ncbi:hypothetical protein [Paraburkholderia terrae]|uniref:Uncharacterized protein n=1 Tax=Paraburkholderia terrae TaxID=311230 RepID=A0A2I8ETU0_9BURK|nr:hypothetical protein [Paraburkholderia terrae]AUT62910.1 hypothetical protein C2L65_25405 [Paraburkholderia terrae]